MVFRDAPRCGFSLGSYFWWPRLLLEEALSLEAVKGDRRCCLASNTLGLWEPSFTS